MIMNGRSHCCLYHNHCWITFDAVLNTSNPCFAKFANAQSFKPIGPRVNGTANDGLMQFVLNLKQSLFTVLSWNIVHSRLVDNSPDFIVHRIKIRGLIVGYLVAKFPEKWMQALSVQASWSCRTVQCTLEPSFQTFTVYFIAVVTRPMWYIK